MPMESVLRELERAGIRLCREEPLREHTSFRIGGPVRAMLFPKGEEQLLQVADILGKAGISPLLIGNGSNLLAADGPLPRVAVKTHDGVGEIERLGETTIHIAAGVLLSRAAAFARSLGLTGLEFAHGIPGSLGGAVVMNAGAYGSEMARVVESVHYLDQNQSRQIAEGDALAFSYRHSRFSNTEDVILGAQITLSPGNPAEIQAKMDDLAKRRRESQPLEYPSGGSAFKRPKGAYAAALIDEVGLKGYAIGGAQISEKHAGFIINRGGATCDEVLRLMEHVQEVVYRQKGIRLEPEIKIIS